MDWIHLISLKLFERLILATYIMDILDIYMSQSETLGSWMMSSIDRQKLRAAMMHRPCATHTWSGLCIFKKVYKTNILVFYAHVLCMQDATCNMSVRTWI